MQLEHSLKTGVSEVELRDRISAYLTKSGYRLVDTHPTLSFQRGSMFGSMMSFSPKGWKTVVVISFSPVGEQDMEVSIKYDIDTTYQLVVEKEHKFWDTELAKLVDAVSTGNVNTGTATEVAQSALKQNPMAFILIVGIVLIMAIVGTVIWRTTTAVWLMSFLGLILGAVIAVRLLKVKIR